MNFGFPLPLSNVVHGFDVHCFKVFIVLHMELWCGETSDRIEDNRDGRCMVSGETEEDADAGPFAPFVV